MRCWLFAVAAFAGFLCGLTGCHHTAGVCDCDIFENRCIHLAPWCHSHVALPPAPVESIPTAPAPLVLGKL